MSNSAGWSQDLVEEWESITRLFTGGQPTNTKGERADPLGTNGLLVPAIEAAKIATAEADQSPE